MPRALDKYSDRRLKPCYAEYKNGTTQEFRSISEAARELDMTIKTVANRLDLGYWIGGVRLRYSNRKFYYTGEEF